jgi:CARDB protein
VLDGGDTAVTLHKSAPALAPGQVKTVKLTFTVATPEPSTQLLAVIDPQARFEDLDRPNNTVAAQPFQ